MREIAQQTQSDRLQLLSVVKRKGPYQSKYFDRQITYRYLFRLYDSHTIESGAYLHFLGGESIPTDLAIDISTMVGCPMACKFCESASISYVRPLTVAEMVSQVTQLVEEHDLSVLPKIVCSFQGIGEPSLIPARVLEASMRLLDIDRRAAISIATTGACLDAFRLWRESGMPIDNLQISHSGATVEQVRWLMPGVPAATKLLAEASLCAQSPNVQKVKFNYILIQGFNDSDEDIRRLILFFKGSPVIVRISALNPTTASRHHGLLPGTLARSQEIVHELQSNGINSFVHGCFSSTDVSCGQLTFTCESERRIWNEQETEAKHTVIEGSFASSTTYADRFHCCERGSRPKYDMERPT